MRDSRAALAIVVLALACATGRSHAPPRQPLGDEGELFVYLQPLPEQAGRVSFVVASVAAVAADGTVAQLELQRPSISGADGRDQRLLASGRVPRGAYTRLRIGLASAALRSRNGKADLLVPPEPFDVGGGFVVARGGALVFQLVLRPAAGDGGSFAFGPDAFAVVSPDPPVPEVTAYASSSGWQSLFVLDTRRKQVVGVVPTGSAPQGIAVDPSARRAYVALPEEDAIAVIDAVSGEPLRRIRLGAGARPGELALARDRRALLVVNAGANSVSFIEPSTGAELSRVATGETPGALLVDRDGRRAYVVSALSHSLTVIDVANRAAVGTISTESPPLRADLSRAGDRLYVVFESSPFLAVYRVPDLSLIEQVFVGMGATFVRVDPETDLVYVAQSGGGRVGVYDPFSLVAVDMVELPAPASWLGIDPVEKALYAIVPSRRSAAILDLSSGRNVAVVDVGAEPYEIVLPGRRN